MPVTSIVVIVVVILEKGTLSLRPGGGGRRSVGIRGGGVGRTAGALAVGATLAGAAVVVGLDDLWLLMCRLITMLLLFLTPHVEQ